MGQPPPPNKRQRPSSFAAADAAAASSSSLSSSSSAAAVFPSAATVIPPASPPSLKSSLPRAGTASPPCPPAAAAPTPHVPTAVAAAASSASRPRTNLQAFSAYASSSSSFHASASAAAPASLPPAPPPPPPAAAPFSAGRPPPHPASAPSANTAAEATRAAEADFPGILEGETDAADRHFPRSEAQRVRDCIKRLCGWTQDSFPGGHPVSLCRANLTEIFRHPYVACEKTDGTRFMLLGASGCLFLLGRRQEVRMLPDSYLPRRDNLHAAQQLTLLDGELVRDRDADGRQLFRYLIYDAVCIEEDTSLREKNLLLRLTAVAERVIAPLRALEEEQKQMRRRAKQQQQQWRRQGRKRRRRQLQEGGGSPGRAEEEEQQQQRGGGLSSSLVEAVADERIICSLSSATADENEKEEEEEEEEEGNGLQGEDEEDSEEDARPSQQQRLRIYLKDFFEICDLLHIQRLALRLPHLSDGVIFTPVNLPYATGTCPLLLKWKPPHLNTADFGVNPLYDERGIPRLFQLYVREWGVLTFKGHFLAPYGKMYKELLEIASTSRSRLCGMMLECYWHPAAPVYTFFPCLRRPSAPGDRDFSRRLIEWEKINGPKPFYDLENGTWKEGGWVVERFRTDKLTPNSSYVVNKVLQSIDDGITFTSLLREFERYRQHGKKTVRELYSLPSPGSTAAAAAPAPPSPAAGAQQQTPVQTK